MEHKKLPQRLVRNAGVFYVCYRLPDGLECDALRQGAECRYR
jgi:hypothetical protein